MTTSNDEHSTLDWGGRLTPSDVHHVLFTRAGLGRRGYDEVEVDVFLERVQQELTRLIGEKADLRDEVSRLKSQLAQAAASPAAAPPTPAAPAATQESAAAPVAAAAPVVDLVTREEAQLQAVRLLAAAQQTADTYVADAEKYSQRLTLDAREHSEQMVAEAREAAKRMVAEAERLAGETAARTVEGQVVTTGGPTQQELEQQVAYLKTFGQVVRVQLRAYLEALLRDVEEEWGKADPGVVAAAPPAPQLAAGRGDAPAPAPVAVDSGDATPAPTPVAEQDGVPTSDDGEQQEPIDLVAQEEPSPNGTHARSRKRTTVTLHSR